ncbi:hypothetical protein AB0953_22055 [Streptomyces sp. NPDC046866]|uniref:hypothetical protein n=1 Tax=Streptomyces sp. NPDC046866 TaxID=3154921 RepID=UPI0034553224
MPYETGAKVKLTREVQVTSDGTAAGAGFAGPLFLAEGLEGIVTGSAGEAGGFAREHEVLDQQIREGRLKGFTADLVEQLRQQVVGQALYGTGAGVGTGIRYRVRFENGFVLDGLGEDCLTAA